MAIAIALTICHDQRYRGVKCLNRTSKCSIFAAQYLFNDRLYSKTFAFKSQYLLKKKNFETISFSVGVLVVKLR